VPLSIVTVEATQAPCRDISFIIDRSRPRFRINWRIMRVIGAGRSIIETIFITLRGSLGVHSGVTYDVKAVLRGCFTSRRPPRPPFQTSLSERHRVQGSRESGLGPKPQRGLIRIQLACGYILISVVGTREVHAFVPSRPFQPSPHPRSPRRASPDNDLVISLSLSRTRALAFRRFAPENFVRLLAGGLPLSLSPSPPPPTPPSSSFP